MARIRLQRFIAQCGVASRRKAEELISSGRVCLNGRRCSELGTTIDPAHDSVTIDGERAVPPDRVLYAYHKLPGTVSTMQDPQGRPDLGRLSTESGHRLFPVGRLDIDVGGLVLLTNDGEYSHELLHPRYQVPRTYVARVVGSITAAKIEGMLAGKKLSDGFGRADSAKELTPHQAVQRFRYWKQLERARFVEVVVHEGRNHFVKRLLGAFELEVQELYRICFGPYRLGSLRPGRLKQLRFERLPDIAATAEPARRAPAKKRSRTQSKPRQRRR